MRHIQWCSEHIRTSQISEWDRKIDFIHFKNVGWLCEPYIRMTCDNFSQPHIKCCSKFMKALLSSYIISKHCSRTARKKIEFKLCARITWSDLHIKLIPNRATSCFRIVYKHVIYCSVDVDLFPTQNASRYGDENLRKQRISGAIDLNILTICFFFSLIRICRCFIYLFSVVSFCCLFNRHFVIWTMFSARIIHTHTQTSLSKTEWFSFAILFLRSL